jgi:hypothetical protein
MTGPPVHLAVTRALESLTVIAEDLATERGVPLARITAPRGSLEWFDQIIDAIATECETVPFEAGRRMAIAALEEGIAVRLDQAIHHMAACTAVTRDGVIDALEARFAEREVGAPANDDGDGR